MRVILIFAILLHAAARDALSQYTSDLLNGDFVHWTGAVPDDWSVGGATLDRGLTQCLPNGGRGRNQSDTTTKAALGNANDPAEAWLYQTVSGLTPGRRYIAGGWFAGDCGTGWQGRIYVAEGAWGGWSSNEVLIYDSATHNDSASRAWYHAHGMHELVASTQLTVIYRLDTPGDLGSGPVGVALDDAYFFDATVPFDVPNATPIVDDMNGVFAPGYFTLPSSHNIPAPSGGYWDVWRGAGAATVFLTPNANGGPAVDPGGNFQDMWGNHDQAGAIGGIYTDYINLAASNAWEVTAYISTEGVAMSPGSWVELHAAANHPGGWGGGGLAGNGSGFARYEGDGGFMGDNTFGWVEHTSNAILVDDHDYIRLWVKFGTDAGGNFNNGEPVATDYWTVRNVNALKNWSLY